MLILAIGHFGLAQNLIPLFSKTHVAVQILFVPERKHWIVTAYHDGEILLYGSLFPGSLSPSIEEQ